MTLKEEVLKNLEGSPGAIVTGGELARQLNVSRTAIWKAVRSLRAEGYAIESLQGSGYRFSCDNDALSPELIRRDTKAKKLGSTLEILKTVDSTSLHLKRKDPRALPEGFTVIADGQTGGLGRRGRYFHSPAGQGVYMSLLLRPDIPPEEIQFLTICTAVGVCRAIEAVYDITVAIKWVNDIFYAGKKLCGILSEAIVSAEAGGVDSVIVGIGVNTGSVEPEVESIATSLYRITGKRGCRNQLIAEMLGQLERVYEDWLGGGQKKAILDEYASKVFIVNQTVRVTHPQRTFDAVVLGVGASGELIVQDGQGVVIPLQSGEVSLILPPAPEASPCKA